MQRYRNNQVRAEFSGKIVQIRHCQQSKGSAEQGSFAVFELVDKLPGAPIKKKCSAGCGEWWQGSYAGATAMVSANGGNKLLAAAVASGRANRHCLGKAFRAEHHLAGTCNILLAQMADWREKKVNEQCQ